MSYYTRIGEHSYRPTEHAGGAWNPTEIHFSALGGLILHEIDLHRGDRGDRGLSLGRVSFDILGFLGTADCEIRVETIRPGRTIELVEAVATIGDRVAVRARAWFLSEFDTSAVEGGAPTALPAPETVAMSSLMVDRWTGGFIRSLDVRPSSARGFPAARPSGCPASTPWSTTSRSATTRRSSRWSTPRTESRFAKARPSGRSPTSTSPSISTGRPSGTWVGLDTSVTFGPTGHGITSTVLHDETGAVGFAHQMLTVRPAR